ncbi:MAG: tRNA (adenosine(37)-N6)-threonylcarbamoyltransferase complex ATPase subunit type 1 TsaE [Erysipelotrichales bacterium]
MHEIKLISKSLDDTSLIADYIASLFKNNNGGVLFLDGDLGAGKTTFTKAFAKHLNIYDVVTSPTFNIFKQYTIDENTMLNHFDLYRIMSNVYDQGFEDYWYSNDYNIIEWSTYLPDEFKGMYLVKIDIQIDNEIRIFKIITQQNILEDKEKINELIY